MILKTRFERKEPEPILQDTDIVAVEELDKEQFDRFCSNLLLDYDFIVTHANFLYDDGNRTHALLVLCEGEEDGILVNSEGSFYARYSSYLPRARLILSDEIRRVADAILNGRFGESEDGAWLIGFDDIKEHLDLTVTPNNGIGTLLLEELESREEVDQVIATEDSLQITEALEQMPETATASERVLTVFSLLGCDLEDVHLLDTDEEHEFATIVELNQNTLTEQGKKDWADVLGAKVERISEGPYGTQIEVSGCDPERLCAFSYMLAGYCSVEDSAKWLTEDAEEQKMGGMTL